MGADQKSTMPANDKKAFGVHADNGFVDPLPLADDIDFKEAIENGTAEHETTLGKKFVRLAEHGHPRTTDGQDNWDDTKECEACLPCITSERLKDTYTADAWPQPGKGPKAGPYVPTMDADQYKAKRLEVSRTAVNGAVKYWIED